MGRKTRILFELGLFFLICYLSLLSRVASSNWWQLLSFWTILIVMVWLTERRGFSSIGLLLASIIAMLGWLFVVRINNGLAFSHWRGMLLGSLAYLVALIINWHRFKYKYTSATLGLLLLSITWFFGDLSYGAKAWLSLAQIRFQPIEVVRLFLLLFLADYFNEHYLLLSSYKPGQPLRYWGPLLIFMILLFILLALQKDLGPALLFYMLFVTLALYAYFNWRLVFVYFSTTLVGIGLSWLCFTHFRLRISAWINPWIDPYGQGYQIIKGLLTINNGGLVGAGLGCGSGVSIPAIHTDYIFALICEELGFIGATLILALYFCLIYFGLEVSRNLAQTSQILAMSIVLLWGYQVFIVIGGLLKIIPLSGMTLPFLSFGGTSFVANMGLLGILTRLTGRDVKAKPAPKNINPRLNKIFYLITSLFLILWGFLGYWQRPTINLANHPLNPKINAAFKGVRGNILDRNGEILAETQLEAGVYVRKYRGPSSLSHIIGYFHQRFGVTGLEQIYNRQLSNKQDIKLTIDVGLQSTVEEIISDYTGAAIVLQPKTGQVLAACSSPAIDNNSLDLQWEQYLDNPASPFFNRWLSGGYPPGSTVKPLVLAAAYQVGLTSADSIWNDLGQIEFDNRVISNFNQSIYGEITSEQALIHSSNVVFAQLAVGLNKRLLSFYRDFGLGQTIDFELANNQGNLPPAQQGAFGWAQLGIGQGPLLVTPLQMACAIGVIANQGVGMEPYIVQSISGNWFQRFTTQPRERNRVISKENAYLVRTAMVGAVIKGTGKAAMTEDVLVGGKTGTAETSRGSAHAWFVGFAPANNPKAVVAVIIEHGGIGGGIAAQIGGEILASALNNI